MATVHTTARGTEPYDKVYCLGYQVHHEDWSPYPPASTSCARRFWTVVMMWM